MNPDVYGPPTSSLSHTESSSHGVQRGPEPARGFVRDRLEGRLPGYRDHRLRVERLDDRLARLGPYHHVAGEQQPYPAVGGQRPVRQRGVAGAENEVLLHLLTELVAQGLSGPSTTRVSTSVGGRTTLPQFPYLPGITRTISSPDTTTASRREP